MQQVPRGKRHRLRRPSQAEALARAHALFAEVVRGGTEEDRDQAEEQILTGAAKVALTS